MAWEDGWRLPGVQAAADLSAKQFFCVVKNTTNKQVALASVDGEVVLGVLQDKPNASGKAAEVITFGVTKVEAGETLAAGDFWGTDSAGKAKIVERTNTGADVGDYVAGQVIVGAASGELATVTIGYPTFQVESV